MKKIKKYECSENSVRSENRMETKRKNGNPQNGREKWKWQLKFLVENRTVFQQKNCANRISVLHSWSVTKQFCLFCLCPNGDF